MTNQQEISLAVGKALERNGGTLALHSDIGAVATAIDCAANSLPRHADSDHIICTLGALWAVNRSFAAVAQDVCGLCEIWEAEDTMTPDIEAVYGKALDALEAANLPSIEPFQPMPTKDDVQAILFVFNFARVRRIMEAVGETWDGRTPDVNEIRERARQILERAANGEISCGSYRGLRVQRDESGGLRLEYVIETRDAQGGELQ